MINLYCDKCKKPIGDTCYCKAVKTVIEKIKKELLEWDGENSGYSVGYNACLREVKDILNKYE